MQFKYIVFILMAWIILSLLVGIAEHVVVGGAVDPATGLPYATSMLAELTTGHFSAKAGAAIALASFNFPAIFYGAWGYVRWIFFLPFGIAFAIMMGGWIFSYIRGGGGGS